MFLPAREERPSVLEKCNRGMHICLIQMIHSIDPIDPYHKTMLIGCGCKSRVTLFEVCMSTVADCVFLGKFINGLPTRIRILRTMFASQTCTSMQRYEFDRWETVESH